MRYRNAAFCVVLRLLAAVDLSLADDSATFMVHRMLQSAASAVGSESEAAATVTADCVPEGLQAEWRSSFTGAVDAMLEKTRRSMQRGLIEVSKSTINLLEGISCGPKAFDRLKEQAGRLNVLASARSLGQLDAQVKYEPFKTLMVGGNDIHVEVNQLISAWKIKNDPEEMGTALVAFLRDFADDSAEPAGSPGDSPEVTAQPSVDIATAPAPASGDKGYSRTPSFWIQALSRVLQRLGGSNVLPEACLQEETAREYTYALDSAFGHMLEKSKFGMRNGLRDLAKATSALLENIGTSCSGTSATESLKRLGSCASRLTIFASAKTLMNIGVHVEYEPMKMLVVGGIDIHKELNRFIVAWLQQKGATEVGEGMADFFEDFAEVVPQEEPAPKKLWESDLLAMIRDALLAASPDDTAERTGVLSADCLPDVLASSFGNGVERALDYMLKKRKRTMQLGLKELADVTDQLLVKMGRSCIESTGAQVIHRAAKKLSRLTRRTVVDYGTHIKYEAMKSLEVGSVAIHAELNQFIAVWKMRSRREAGTPFGELMRKCSTIGGHDEL